MRVVEPGWPDTTTDAPPTHDSRSQGEWLVGRHPRLARLLERVDGAVRRDSGGLTLDLDALASVFVGIAAYERALVEYYNSGPHPSSESPPDATDFVPAAPGGELPMSYGEAASVQVLAMLAPTIRVPFKLSDLDALDREGRLILTDWCRLLPT